MKKNFLKSIIGFFLIFVLCSCTSFTTFGEDVAPSIYISYEMYKGEKILLPIINTRYYSTGDFPNLKGHQFDGIEGENLELISYDCYKDGLEITALEDFGERVVHISKVRYVNGSNIFLINIDVFLYENFTYSELEPSFGNSDYLYYFLLDGKENDWPVSYTSRYYDGSMDENGHLLDTRTLLETKWLSPEYFGLISNIKIDDISVNTLDGKINYDKKMVKCKDEYTFHCELDDYEEFMPIEISKNADGIATTYVKLGLILKNVSDYDFVGTTISLNVTIGEESFQIKRLLIVSNYING